MHIIRAICSAGKMLVTLLCGEIFSDLVLFQHFLFNEDINSLRSCSQVLFSCSSSLNFADWNKFTSTIKWILTSLFTLEITCSALKRYFNLCFVCFIFKIHMKCHMKVLCLYHKIFEVIRAYCVSEGLWHSTLHHSCFLNQRPFLRPIYKMST